MNKDNAAIDYEECWAIDLDWFQGNARSFTVLVEGALCQKCRTKLKADDHEIKPKDILKTIKTCCSKSVDYITPSLPLHETIFRIFLANGNLPLTLREIGEQLNQWRGLDVYRTSVPVLSRLLKNDRHYGLHPVRVNR